jgi:hypothetical protein
MRYEERRPNSTAAKSGVVVVAVLAIAGIAYFMMKEEAPAKLRELPAPPPPLVVEAPKVPEKPAYAEPAPAARPEPLPALNQSDVAVVAALQGLNIDGLLQMVIPEEILRKFVRAVDAVEEGKLINEYRPIVSPKGALLVDSFRATVAGSELGTTAEVEQFRMSAKNYKRYDTYASMIVLLDSDATVAMYNRFYPLLSEAYKEMGLTKGNFHSVFIRAIDNIIAAPEVSGDLNLVRPKVYFEFADPALEKLPATHKLMLRMGPENANRVKSSMKNLRAKLIQKQATEQH